MSSSLRLGIVLKGGIGWIGGQEYIKNLVITMDRLAQEKGIKLDLSLITRGEIPDSIRRQMRSPLNVVRIGDGPPPTRFGRIRRLLDSRPIDSAIDRAVRSVNLDFVYPVDSLSVTVPCRRAAWIPDLQHRVFPEYFTSEELADRENWIDRMLADAPCIVFSSAAAVADFRANYPQVQRDLRVLRFRVNIPEEMFAVDPAATARRYNLPPNYLLTCNQLWQHKNHLLLLEALELAVRDYPDMTVVLTGSLHDYRKPEYIDQFLGAIHRRNLGANLRLLGLIPKLDQIQLIRSCLAVVQPSLFEGWSTIVEEAHCLGKSLILSDIPVHREQHPPLTTYFNPRDAPSLAAQLRAVWSAEPPLYSSQAESVARSDYAQLFKNFGVDFFDIAMSDGDARTKIPFPGRKRTPSSI